MKIPALFAAAALSFAPVFAQKPADPSPSEALLRQIDPVTGTPPGSKALPLPGAASDPRPAEELVAKPLKKEKGPTEIDALEATFNQKTNLAVFIGEVTVKDPEFNVTCDKLTAHLRGAEKTKPVAEVPAPKPSKPATPAAATPAPTAAKKKGGSGLQRAIAEASAGGRVVITQEKTDLDGSVQISTGRADRATYDAVTGDIVLTGKPEVQQGINLVIATAQSTKMTLNRDGHMRAEGPHKTIITEKGDAGF